MNLPKSSLENLLEQLPALRNPTVSPLAHDGWVAVETVIDEKIVREIIPQLKALGAEVSLNIPSTNWFTNTQHGFDQKKAEGENCQAQAP